MSKWLKTGTKRSEPFQVTKYALHAKGAPVDRPLRVALACDLHNRPCDVALAALRESKPDIVLIGGDLMECYRPDDIEAMLMDIDEQSADEPRWKQAIYRTVVRVDAILGKRRHYDGEIGNANAFRFLHEAVRIAPTLYALGNHERYMDDDARRGVARMGAVLLDNSSICVKVRGVELLVGGLCSRRGAGWLESFAAERTDGVKLLICHQPEYYDKYIKDKDVGVIFAGHAHGGQWRLFGRPLFAPGQGLFPKRAGGVYDGRLVVSRGLSNTAHVPRFGNPTELVIVELDGR